MSNQAEVIISPAAQTTVEVLAPSGAVVEILQPSASTVVEVSVPGPQGPSGAAQATYTHQQTTPSATWTINHNLGFKPSVELLNSGSQEIEGDVVHASTNQVVVSFTGPVAGLARLN